MTELKTAPLLYEMLKSFTILAEELNLSRAVERLDSTRQTVRRHIAVLEELRGEVLFVIEDRRYALTSAGAFALREAREIVTRSEAWGNRLSGHVSDLQRFSGTGKHLSYFELQQHPLGELWNSSPKLLRDLFHAWADAEGALEAEPLKSMRAHVVVFRRVEDNWVCVEIGRESSYTSWFGETWALSSVGVKTAKLPGGKDFGLWLNAPYDEVSASQGVRLDHIVTELPRENIDNLVPISYQRLLLGCRFANQSKGLISAVFRTYNVDISGIDRDTIEQMPAELCMD